MERGGRECERRWAEASWSGRSPSREERARERVERVDARVLALVAKLRRRVFLMLRLNLAYLLRTYEKRMNWTHSRIVSLMTWLRCRSPATRSVHSRSKTSSRNSGGGS